ncbi:DNA-binding response regulator [Sphaerisporangium album]|uniref:DNA-binding response regulator n=1 Tax=Sphaerisporangium album TaxID=509200 RepID=A0A367FFQ9_9ACTN|nr:response regulator transcription factor [Sphaerisporangium album]RCG28652.1 DNA-binding response regulator [Sphaerisporangium album]
MTGNDGRRSPLISTPSKAPETATAWPFWTPSATVSTAAVCPVGGRSTSGLTVRSHTRTVLSSPPETATVLPFRVPIATRAHVSSVLAKLGLGNRTQIAPLAHDAGLA